MDDKKKDLVDKLAGLLQDLSDKHQERPDQYVVAIYKKGATEKDDRLIGYHESSMGQVTDDILEAKRYSGLDPYSEQIPVCAKNIGFIADATQEREEGKLFGDLCMRIKRERYEGITSKDIYLKAVYLNENTPKQEMRYTIV